MEPFNITCTTCRSRIRVRNAELIGQLVNCPKCNSIVLVADPSQPIAQTPGAQQVDSRALTKDGIDPFGTETEGKVLSGDPQDFPDEFRLSPEEQPFSGHSLDRPPRLDSPNWPSESPNAANQTSLSASMESISPPVRSATGRAAPNEAWTSETTRRKRQLLIVSFLGLSSLFVTGVLFVLFLRWYNESPQANRGPGSQLNSPATDGDEPVVEEGGVLEEGAVDGEGADQLEPSRDGAALEDLNRPAEFQGEDKADLIAGQQAALDTSASELSSEEASVEDVASVQPVPADRSPVNIDEPPSEPGFEEVGQVDPTPAETIAAENLPSRLLELAQLIGEPFEFSAPQTLIVPDRAPVTAEELGISTASVDKSLPPVDLHVASNERIIRGFRLDDVPLAHAVNYLSLASGLPMSVDVTSLAAANVDRTQKVRFVLDSSSTAEGVHKFTQLIGLQLHSIENRYYRLSSGLPNSELLPLQIEIGDLASTDEDLAWLREILNQFFPQVAKGIEIQDSALVASPESVDLQSWFGVVRAMENWRMQRGLPSKLPSYSLESLRVPFVRSSEVKVFEQPLQLVSSSSQPLAALITSLCAGVGIQCWVDWPSLASIGLAPGSLKATVTLNRPLRNVLQELAFEHDLVPAIIDERTLWLTNQPTYRQSPQVFIIPSEDRNLDYWAQFFRPLSPVGESGVSGIKLLLTPDEKFVFVKCCYPNLQFE